VSRFSLPYCGALYATILRIGGRVPRLWTENRGGHMGGRGGRGLVVKYHILSYTGRMFADEQVTIDTRAHAYNTHT